MTSLSEQYVKLLDEMSKQRTDIGLSRSAELLYAIRLDAIWLKLSDDERDAINAQLTADDRVRDP